MKKIVITGPESTGKSSLAKSLSAHFKSPMVPEYAVEYLDNLGREYAYNDLVKIAKGQIELEEMILSKSKSKFGIIDTDLITIKIWSKVKFDKVNRWIMKTIRGRKYDLYLLCKPDIPWEYSEYRENPDDRDWLFTLYEKELKKYKKKYVIIEGLGQERTNTAINIIKNLACK